MKYLLSVDNVDLVKELADTHLLLAFDFDGTLAPIVSRREAAVMRRRTAAMFARVCALYPCAVISGRSQSDVQTRLEGATVKYVVGNHGIEPGVDLERYEGQIATARTLLVQKLEHVYGIEHEDKRYTLALHYRRSPNKRAAREQIRDALAALPFAVRTMPGKYVINVLPDGARSKGDAVQDLTAQEEAKRTLYIGDDVTDEDVFALKDEKGLATVRVGYSASSAAQYFINNQVEIDRVLALLASFRDKAPRS